MNFDELSTTPRWPEETEPNRSAGDAQPLPRWRPVPGSLFPPEGEKPGRYRIDSVEAGGMGLACVATDLHLDRKVVIKTVLPGRVHDSAQALFDQEMLLMAKLDAQPGIAQLYHTDLFHVPGDSRERLCRYLIIEFFRGGVPLKRYVQEQAEALGWRERVDLMIRACEAVGAAHRLGIVHRDLKSGNILARTAPGKSKKPVREVKVIDWGIATLHGADGWLVNSQVPPSAFEGTLNYMAPEQCEKEFNPEKLTSRTDVYALGVILYELLTGDLPYGTAPRNAWDDALQRALERGERTAAAQEEAQKAARAIICDSARVPLLGRGGLFPVGLENIVNRALQREPLDRFADAEEMASALRRFTEGRTKRALAVGTGVTAAAVYLGYVAGVPAVFEMTPLNRWYQTVLAWVCPASPDILSHVVVIAFDPTTDLAALSRAAHLPVPEEGQPISIRPLIGMTLEKVQEAGARAAGVDVFMKLTSPVGGADASLEGSLKRLNQAKRFMPVVFGYESWSASPDEPGINESLTPEVRRSGCAVLEANSESMWRAELVYQPTAGGVEPSLALATYAAAQQPDWMPQFAMDQGGAAVEIRYVTPRTGGLGESLPLPEYVTLTTTKQPKRGEEAAGGVVGLCELLAMPDERSLDRCTVAVQSFLAMTPAQQHDLVAGKVVVLGTPWGPPNGICGVAPKTSRQMAETRKGPDPALQPDLRNRELNKLDAAESFPGGRLMPKVYAHATALGKMRNGTIAVAAGVPGELGATVLAAACGVAAAHMETRRKRVRAMLVLATMAGLILAGVGLFLWFDVLLNPMVPCLAAVTGFAICLIIYRLMRPASEIVRANRARAGVDKVRELPTAG